MAYEQEAREAKQRTHALGDHAKQEARGANQTVREDARDIAHDGRERVRGMAGQQKERLAAHIEEISHSLRGASDSLEAEEFAPARKYGKMAADRIDRAAEYIRSNDVEQLTNEVGGFARRNPELFLGGAFLAGIALGRFLRASSPRVDTSYSSPHVDDIDDQHGASGRYGESDRYAPDYASSDDIGAENRPYGGTAPDNPYRSEADVGPYGRTTVGGYGGNASGIGDERRGERHSTELGATGSTGAAGSTGGVGATGGASDVRGVAGSPKPIGGEKDTSSPLGGANLGSSTGSSTGADNKEGDRL